MHLQGPIPFRKSHFWCQCLPCNAAAVHGTDEQAAPGSSAAAASCCSVLAVHTHHEDWKAARGKS